MPSDAIQPRRPRSGKLKLCAATTVALLSIGGGAALAGGGGVGAPQPPKLRDVTCLKGCAGLREAAPGAKVQLSGRNLEYTSLVRFKQRGGGRVTAEPRSISATSVEALVPDQAASGRPQVVDSSGQLAESPVELKIVSASSVQSGGAGVSDVEATPQKGYFAGKRQATASFLTKGSSPQDVRVDVVDAGDGSVVRSIVEEDVEPQSPTQVRWNGKTDSGAVAPNGKYDFSVRPMSGGSGAKAGFKQFDHIFPVRGKHQYGDGMGAGRNHQGQDVFAKCGKRIVAARGGKVQHKAYHSAAGYYVVVDGKKTDIDYAYMHLQRQSKLRVGKRVKTGQLIGRNGETGNASGCHLHFEMWKGGWYEGGKPVSPTKHMKRWDGWS